MADKTQIIRISQNVKMGEIISDDNLSTVEVGNFNLPSNALTEKEAIIGHYATTDLFIGDYLFTEKLSPTPATENGYLYRLNGEKQAISITVKTFSSGLSGKLISGDIVSVVAPDYLRQGETITPPELRYVEVIAVTASSGNDANQHDVGSTEDQDERELPATVTLLVSPEQANLLADLESEGKLHLTLVYRGEQAVAAEFITAQEEVILELYPLEDDEKSEDDTSETLPSDSVLEENTDNKDKDTGGEGEQ